MRNKRVLLLVVVLLIIGCANGSPVSSPSEMKAEKDMLDNMDTSVNPCQDFFQYACGGWIKNNPIPNTKSSTSQFDILNGQLATALRDILEMKSSPTDSKPLKIARDMFDTCMDTAHIEEVGLKPLTDYLATFGGWPMTVDMWNESSFDWKQVSASACAIYDEDILIAVNTEPDEMNTTVNAIHIDQGGVLLPRSTMMNLAGNPQTASAYTALIVGSAKAIRDSLKSKVTDAQIQFEVNVMLRFETELAMITVPDEERRDNSRMYNALNVTQLQQWTDSVGATTPQGRINWLDYLNDIYSTYAHVKIPASERVIVVEKDYLKKLAALLDKTPSRALANYVIWRLVYALADDTTKQMTDLQFEFEKAYEGVSQPSSRVTKCVEEMNDVFGFALSSVYVKKILDDQGLSEIKLMISNLKRAFKSLVDDSTWMDKSTKATAKDKVDAMIDFVGYPYWISNNTAIEEYYDGIKPATRVHFQNIQDINALINQQDLQGLRDTPSRYDWSTSPTTVNAYYTDSTNSITFPAAILQSPYFSKGRLAAVNYGAIGSTIGHEITHGFDDEGRQSDKYGNTAQWWTEQTLKNYQERAQCFVDQYSNYTVLNGTARLNGINTQGENIADNGGLRESYRAYRYYVSTYGAETPQLLNMTGEQTFFLAYANNFCGAATNEELRNLIETDPHSPFRFRVIGTLSNNEDFVNAFECAVGTPMNRVNKCVLW